MLKGHTQDNTKPMEQLINGGWDCGNRKGTNYGSSTEIQQQSPGEARGDLRPVSVLEERSISKEFHQEKQKEDDIPTTLTAKTNHQTGSSALHQEYTGTRNQIVIPKRNPHGP
ncbi:hypothetical protein T265_07940 [Opisthorchis viverrini]|uniref:Uncharacterized protein n=1 Tax=Opisthorchis viverrini TaxID=6198 RepID=A0A074ZAQ1_OPIVI|nr:hypothetical protein T265_07940 [Opisthorchis viverrini]KER24381.1 hypothetical protein T265_07940 [Opisthorchis viverrini]